MISLNDFRNPIPQDNILYQVSLHEDGTHKFAGAYSSWGEAALRASVTNQCAAIIPFRLNQLNSFYNVLVRSEGQWRRADEDLQDLSFRPRPKEFFGVKWQTPIRIMFENEYRDIAWEMLKVSCDGTIVIVVQTTATKDYTSRFLVRNLDETLWQPINIPRCHPHHPEGRLDFDSTTGNQTRRPSRS